MENLQGGTLALEHRYDVLQRRGRHGFVTLYFGRQDPFDKQVWVEVYDALAEAGADAETIARLKHAAQATSQLDTPGVLRVIDYGEIDAGMPFVISERSAGASLEALLDEEGTLAAEAVSELLGRLAAVLEPAHRRHLPHGSLGPRWIYLPDGDLTRAVVGHFQLSPSVAEILATENGVMTPDAVEAFPPEMFVSDEQERDDEPFTVAGDVWAMGILAYRCLVGVHPFFEDELDASEGILRLRNEEARPLDELGIDPEISAVIARALSKEPRERFASPAALAEAFDAALRPDLAAAEPTKPAAPASSPAEPEAEPERDDDRFAIAATSPSRSERPPGPSDRLLTAALVLLVVSNLAWIFYVTGSAPADQKIEASSNKPIPPAVVTGGLEIDTRPSGATVIADDGEEPSRLGETPMLIRPNLLKKDSLELEFRKPGYKRQVVLIGPSSDQGPEVTLPLEESSE